MRLGAFYEKVLGSLSADEAISVDELCHRLGVQPLKAVLVRIDSALDGLTRRHMVESDMIGERRAWLWRLDPGALVAETPMDAEAMKAAVRLDAAPAPPEREYRGRPRIGDPGFVYRPLSEATKAKMRAAHRKRTNTPEGFCRMYDMLVPIAFKPLCQEIARRAVKRERDRVKVKL